MNFVDMPKRQITSFHRNAAHSTYHCHDLLLNFSGIFIRIRSPFLAHIWDKSRGKTTFAEKPLYFRTCTRHLISIIFPSPHSLKCRSNWSQILNESCDTQQTKLSYLKTNIVEIFYLNVTFLKNRITISGMNTQNMT